MGAEERQPDATLSATERAEAERRGTLAAFASSARRFDFYRLVYLLERLHANAPRIGHTGPARDERIRLRADSSLVFAPSDVSALAVRRYPDAQDRVEITAAFLGLYGAVSPLPPYFVEKIALSDYQGGPQPVRELLDVIHHRIFSLAYRAWGKYRHSVGYRTGGADKFTQRMFCAVGVDGFRKSATPLSPFYFLRFAPLLTTKSRSARGLEVVLKELFGDIPVALDQFVGSWTLVEKPLRNRLGQANHQLGESLVIGRYVYDGSGRYTVKLGPLGYDDYLSFLPGGHRRPLIKAIVDTFTPGIHDAMLELSVDLESAPRLQLGSPRSATLSRTAWLGGALEAGAFKITVPLDERPDDDVGRDEERGEPPPLP